MKDWEYDTAGDHGLGPGEKLKSLQREAGLPARISQSCWRAFMRTYFKLYHRLGVLGREHLPAGPPCIVVANHASHLDALALAAALPAALRRSAFPIAAGDAFFETPVASFFAAMALNALPMWRHRCARHAMEELRERLVAEPAVYILFPEGTRSRDGMLGRFKPGVGMLVAGTEVPVVPAYIEGAFAAAPPGKKFPRPRRLTLRFGSRVTFPGVLNERAGWQEVARELHEAVVALGRHAD